MADYHFLRHQFGRGPVIDFYLPAIYLSIIHLPAKQALAHFISIFDLNLNQRQKNSRT
jgi:hypothetical protein